MILAVRERNIAGSLKKPCAATSSDSVSPIDASGHVKTLTCPIAALVKRYEASTYLRKVAHVSSKHDHDRPV